MGKEQVILTGELTIEIAGEVLPVIREAIRRKGLEGDYDHYVMPVIRTMAISLGVCSQHLPASWRSDRPESNRFCRNHFFPLGYRGERSRNKWRQKFLPFYRRYKSRILL